MKQNHTKSNDSLRPVLTDQDKTRGVGVDGVRPLNLAVGLAKDRLRDEDTSSIDYDQDRVHPNVYETGPSSFYSVE